MTQHTNGSTATNRVGLLVCVLGVAQVTFLCPAGAQAVQEVATPFRQAPGLPVARYQAPVATAPAATHPVLLTPPVAATPALAIPVPTTPAAATRRWDVLTSDVTLSKTLERWARAAGYRVKWDAARNFQIDAPTAFEGDFEGALEGVLSTPGIRSSDYPLEACIYSNTPPLVRITRQGEQARDCGAAASAASVAAAGAAGAAGAVIAVPAVAVAGAAAASVAAAPTP